MADDLCLRLLENPNKKEVLSWLRAGRMQGCTLGELATTDASIKLAEEIYKAGAIEVTAVEIDGEAGQFQNTGKLVIKLSDDKQARERIFSWNAKNAESLGFDADKDSGQKYLYVSLD